jgi:hypothetical protein
MFGFSIGVPQQTVDWASKSGKPIEPGQKAPAGSLLISDTFEASGEAPHGVSVRRAAVEQGFQGQVFVHSPKPGQQLVASQESLRELHSPQSAQKTLAAVDSYAVKFSVGLLNDETAAVNRANSTKSTHTALNLSQGSSKASIAEFLYKRAASEFGSGSMIEKMQAQTWYGSKGGTPVTDNYAAAFGLDKAKLMSEDPKVSGPERAKLQQALIDRTSKTLDESKDLKTAKSQFLTSVKNFESRHNSVVIAAGNEGDIASNLQKSNGGHKLRLPKDFDANVLENSEVTSVGATRWFQNGSKLTEVRANYSTKSPGIDIWASGSMADAPAAGQKGSQEASIFGTSFAAPRVAATMAQLHKDNPKMSSAQIESLMKEKLTHPLASGQGEISVLDYQSTASYLAGHKF